MNTAHANGPEPKPEAEYGTVESSSHSTTRIGHSIDELLENMLWKLVSGELGLNNFSPAFQMWWCIAADQGRASMQPRIDRLEWERDYWYFRATNPGQDYYRAQTDQLWREGVAA